MKRGPLVPLFEVMPLRAIYQRNFGRRNQMTVAALKAVSSAEEAGVPQAEWGEIHREALRPFDRYAHQRGEFLQ